jgi:oxygen-independent coproporphyrinogen-3 oxidase
LDFNAIEPRFGIVFKEYFARELAELAAMEKDGLVVLEQNAVQVTAPGRMLIRRICMVFDAWLRRAVAPQGFSKII